MARSPGTSSWAKKVTGCYSMAVGGVGINQGVYDKDKSASAIDNVDLVLDRFAAGEFDLVAVGRAIIGDPDWARKIRSRDPIRPYSVDDLLSLA